MSKTYKDVCDTEEQIRAQKNKNQQYRQQLLDVDREIDAMVLKIDTFRALKMSESSKSRRIIGFIKIITSEYLLIYNYYYTLFKFYTNTITEQKKMFEEKQTKVDVIQEEDSNGVIEVPVPEQFSPEK